MTTTARESAPADRGVDDHAAPGDSPFEPVAVPSRYEPPRASIDPDRTKGWIRRVLPVVMAHRRLLVGSLAAALIALLVSVAVPAVTRAAIDGAIIDGTRPLGPFVWLLLGLALARGLLAATYRYGLFRMAYEIEFDLRALLHAHLSTLSFSFYDRVQSGQVISRANSDIRSVQIFGAFAPLMGMTILTFVVALVFMLSIHIGLTIVAVGALPGVFVAGVRLRNHVFPLSWIVQARLAEVATIVDENVNGVRVVKSYAAEERQIGLLARAAQRIRWATVTMADSRARYSPVMENLPRVGLVAVLAYGGWLAIDGQVSIGTLVAFNAYVLMLQAPFRMLGFFLILGQRAAASADRIFEILDEPAEIVDAADATDLEHCDGALTFAGVDFAYEGGQPVLVGFDLEIAAGESVAIVGRTGSGKSTIVRLLPRFYDVTAGSVRVDGHDVRDLTVASLRRHIGIVTDEPFLFSVSLRDNIGYARPGAEIDRVVDAARAAQAHDFIEALPEGYDTVVGERGYTLSGGQRQRIAIARALLADPQVLILDDATSAVDVQVEARIHQALNDRLAGRTTLIIAHRLSSIAMADRVVLIEGGRVVASGVHDDLLAREPRYVEILAHLDDEVPEPLDTGAAPPPPGQSIDAGRPRGLDAWDVLR